MTKKDYKLIASVLATSRLTSQGTEVFSQDLSTLNDVCLRLSDELARDNPRFDREKFLLASRCSVR